MPQFSSTEQLLVNAAGREYRLRIWRPSRPESAAPIDTLLFLDGHWLDDTLDAAIAALAPANIQFASLGYRVAERSILAPWRAYDYTPPGPPGRQSDPRNSAWPCGGADALLAFLRTRVMPLLAPAAPAASGSTALFGHSYAGLFSLYCWLNAAPLFSRIYAASPSLWWYWPHMLDLLKARQAGDAPGMGGHAPLHLFVGTEERWRPLPAVPGAPREPGVSTVPFAQSFLAAVLASGHSAATLQLFEGQAHGPMLHAAARYALEHFVATEAPIGIRS